MSILVPPKECTIALKGDEHIGRNLPAARYTKLALAANRGDSAIAPKAALHVQIGDQVEGNDNKAGNDIATTPEQDGVARAWLDSYDDPVVAIVGNHDIIDRVVPGVASPTDEQKVAQWALDYNQPEKVMWENDRFRFLGCYWNFTGTEGEARLSWMESMIRGATKPVVTAMHYPPRQSINGDVTGMVEHAGNIDTWDPAWYGYCLGFPTDTAYKELIGEYPQVKACLHGHTHTWHDAARFAFMMSAGPRRVLSLNASANTYRSGTYGLQGYRTALIAFYLTLLDGEIQLRTRDESQGVYIARDGVNPVEHFPYVD